MSERQGIEIDYCPQCRGVWLDRGELDKIIERSGREAAVAAPQPAPQRRPSLIAGATMIATTTMGAVTGNIASGRSRSSRNCSTDPPGLQASGRELHRRVSLATGSTTLRRRKRGAWQKE
jgi:hypothetical protein